MIDFSRLRKLIYFPHRSEYQRDPVVIYVLDRWGTEWRGGMDPQRVLAREFQFYSDKRCQPYSDELWWHCENWTKRRLELEQEFERLRERGRL